MKTVDELKRYIADKYPLGHSTNCAFAVTGDPYVRIGSQHPGVPAIPGTIDDRQSAESWYDEETACMAAYSSFLTYSEGRTGKLYYRAQPQLEWNDDKARPARCKVYIRLVISDKPETSTACERCNCGRAP